MCPHVATPFQPAFQAPGEPVATTAGPPLKHGTTPHWRSRLLLEMRRKPALSRAFCALLASGPGLVKVFAMRARQRSPRTPVPSRGPAFFFRPIQALPLALASSYRTTPQFFPVFLRSGNTRCETSEPLRRSGVASIADAAPPSVLKTGRCHVWPKTQPGRHRARKATFCGLFACSTTRVVGQFSRTRAQARGIIGAFSASRALFLFRSRVLRQPE